jgi:uncharacterized protein (DUF2384 family)
MGKKKGLSPTPCQGLFMDEEADVRKEAARLVKRPDKWLDMPNDQLGGKSPNELIGTDQEQQVRDLLRAIEHGMPT